jgi:hypothetical protein
MSYRGFFDRTGTAWEVWEAHPTLTERRQLRDRRARARASDERRTMNVALIALASDSRGWLAFRSTLERRRTPIPERWEELSDVGLRALLYGARLSGQVQHPSNEHRGRTYSAARALNEATGLAASRMFAAFSLSFGRYVATGAGEQEMVDDGRTAAREMRRHGMSPERFLRALRIANATVPRIAPMNSMGRLSDMRVTHATDLFLLAYFER